MKVLVLGLSRTGTSSLRQAFLDLGNIRRLPLLLRSKREPA